MSKLLDAVDIFERGTNLPTLPVEVSLMDRQEITSVLKLWFLIRPRGLNSHPTPTEPSETSFSFRRINNVNSHH
jgi:hypothetical protein